MYGQSGRQTNGFQDSHSELDPLGVARLLSETEVRRVVRGNPMRYAVSLMWKDFLSAVFFSL